MNVYLIQICKALGEVNQYNEQLLAKYRKEMKLRKKYHNELVELKGRFCSQISKMGFHIVLYNIRIVVDTVKLIYFVLDIDTLLSQV